MQKSVWEQEYKNPRLVSGNDVAPASLRDFVRWLKKERRFLMENIRAIDLGCGNGKNAHYIAEFDRGNRVIGVDISETALAQAKTRRDKLVTLGKIDAGQVEYLRASIGSILKFSDNSSDNANDSFDLALDVMASNSLSEKERRIFLAEVHRLLKPGGYFFTKALCKDGDTNAAALLKNHPGPEKDAYIMPELGLTERVFSRQDFIDTYSGIPFDIIRLEKETHYSRFAGRSYKRNFWVAYIRKPQRMP